MRLSGSHTERFRTNYFAERYPFYGRFVTFVKSKDDGVAGTGGTITQQLVNMDQAIEDAVEGNEGSRSGARPYKFNTTTRYRFSEGRLRGLALGGAYIWQDRALMQRSGAREFSSKTIHQTNLFANYDWKTPWRKQTVKLQLNVNNAFNETIVTTARYNAGLNGVRRVYLRAPRDVRFSATLPF
jgi:outer membrane receptor for ferric coprogen and ferric-rhodotorulic acid